MISGLDLVYFGPEPWGGMWRNRHHLLTRLARANRVVYVAPRVYSSDLLASLRAGELTLADLRSGGVAQDRQNLWVYRWPGWAPVGGGPALRPITRWLRRGHLRGTLNRLGIRNPVVFFSRPDHADHWFDLPARLRVYHIVDDYMSYFGLPDGLRPVWQSQEGLLIDGADLVLAVSPQLIESKGAGNTRFRLLPNAVDTAAYTPDHPAGVTPELHALPRPILGYVGLISVRLDLAMLDALAQAHPEWTLALVGSVDRAGCEALLDNLAARPNVFFLGAVPATRVPDYVCQFDLGMAPYRVTEETCHASPLKIYEYLAAGLPVVAADVPGARQFSEIITIAGEPAGWDAAVAAELAANTASLASRRREAVAPHSWDARVETLSAYLADALARRFDGEVAA